MIPSTDDFTVSDLFQAYYDCRKTKRNSLNALEFEENLERNLMDLYYDLKNGSYAPGASTCFVVEYPKIREVWAANFRDRVVHHLLYNKIKDRFHNRFIFDSYACIPEKGIHRAVERAESFCRSITQNYSIPGYVLKMDVANFFVSVDKYILEKQLKKHTFEPWWVELCLSILHHDPTKDAIIKSSAYKLNKVPHHKSLFNANGQGLPIGNLSSQFFANVYLNDLDQFAKHVLKIKHYIRYVDDIVVFDIDVSKLSKIPEQLDKFLIEKLNLKLHPKKISINKIEHGFDMLGFVIRPYARYIRRSTVNKIFNHVNTICENGISDLDLLPIANSYFNLLSNSNSRKISLKLANYLENAGYHISITNKIKMTVP